MISVSDKPYPILTTHPFLFLVHCAIWNCEHSPNLELGLN